MTLSGDNIIETSLLKPTKQEHGTSPTLKEEAVLLGKEPKPPETPKPHPSQNTQRPLNHKSPQSRLILSTPDPLSKLMFLVPLLLCPLHPNLAATLPRRQRNPRERLGLMQTMQVSGSAPTCRGTKECQNGERIPISPMPQG